MQNSAKKVKPKQHRLFFALWPDDTVRKTIKKRIQPHIAKQPAKNVPLHNWHITLAFLGNVSAEIKECVHQNAVLVNGQSFTLQLDQLGYFQRARVAWLGCSDSPDALNDLYAQLNTALKPCGYETEYKILVPHMTLLRKAHRKPKVEAFEPVEWQVRDFVLVESEVTERGSTYNVIDRWRLNP